MSKSINLITIFIFIFLIKIFIFDTYYLSGHDSFQYTHWAEVLFTDKYNFTFFRPFLYLILNIGLLLSDYSIYYFYYTLLFFSFLNYLLIVLISNKLKLNNNNLYLILCLVFLSNLLLIGDSNNIISSIELFLVLSLFFSFLFNSKKSLILFHLLGLSITLVHEDKFILYFIFYVLTILEKRKYSSLYFLFSVITLLALYLNFGLNGDSSAFRVAGSVSLSWNNHLDIVGNVFKTLISTISAFNPIVSFLSLVYLFYLFIDSKNISNYYDFFKNYYIPLFITLYFIIIGFVFAGIDLPRTTSPVYVIILFYILKRISVSNKFLFFSYIILLINIYPIYLQNINIHKEENRYYNAYNFLINNSIKDRVIYLSRDFENRNNMWGSANKYGLKSTVYDSNNIIMLELNGVPDVCPDVVFFKVDSDIFNNCIYQNISHLGVYKVAF